MSNPDCPECKTNDFIPIPDSLAIFCRTCGFVWVGLDDDWRPGATIQQWAKDIYEKSQERGES